MRQTCSFAVSALLPGAVNLSSSSSSVLLQVQAIMSEWVSEWVSEVQEREREKKKDRRDESVCEAGDLHTTCLLPSHAHTHTYKHGHTSQHSILFFCVCVHGLCGCSELMQFRHQRRKVGTLLVLFCCLSAVVARCCFAGHGGPKKESGLLFPKRKGGETQLVGMEITHSRRNEMIVVESL